MKRIALLIAAMSASASGYTADLAVHSVLTLDGAKSVAASALKYAQANKAPGAAVAVVDTAGNPIYLERIDGTFAAAPTISIGKARTAVFFNKPTRVLEEIINKGRTAMAALPDTVSFTPLQGGVPIVVDGSVVGAIGVSGASSAQQDDEIATAGAEAFMKTHGQKPAAVNFVPHAQVSAAFEKDATLISDPAFRVAASRRDRPGEAEVHLHDADIFYVVQGSAELVTGGEVVGPHSISDSEIRGTQIKGGEEQHIAKGDVITIPRGVPHWFREVKAPFLYYVVKSTTSG